MAECLRLVVLEVGAARSHVSEDSASQVVFHASNQASQPKAPDEIRHVVVSRCKCATQTVDHLRALSALGQNSPSLICTAPELNLATQKPWPLRWYRALVLGVIPLAKAPSGACALRASAYRRRTCALLRRVGVHDVQHARARRAARGVERSERGRARGGGERVAPGPRC